jgi:hypothetical protein
MYVKGDKKMNYKQKIKVIMPVRDIPEGSEVTKPIGNKQYRLLREIRIFGDEPLNIKADDGSAFIGVDAYFNVVSADQELAWVTTIEEFCIHVDNELRDQAERNYQ